MKLCNCARFLPQEYTCIHWWCRISFFLFVCLLAWGNVNTLNFTLQAIHTLKQWLRHRNYRWLWIMFLCLVLICCQVCVTYFLSQIMQQTPFFMGTRTEPDGLTKLITTIVMWISGWGYRFYPVSSCKKYCTPTGTILLQLDTKRKAPHSPQNYSGERFR